MHVRDSQYLNWRYVDFPYGERIIRSIIDASGAMRGFIVVQKEIRKERLLLNERK